MTTVISWDKASIELLYHYTVLWYKGGVQGKLRRRSFLPLDLAPSPALADLHGARQQSRSSSDLTLSTAGTKVPIFVASSYSGLLLLSTKPLLMLTDARFALVLPDTATIPFLP